MQPLFIKYAYTGEGIPPTIAKETAMDDKSIIMLYNDRSEDAIACTKEKYGKALFSLSYGILQSREEAEECENDTYLEAWNRIPPSDPSDYFYPFLARIARHLSLDRCRRSSAQKRSAHIVELSEELIQCLPDGASTEKEYDDRELERILNAFLSELNAEMRKVFVRRYFFLEDISCIATRYSYSESKVKSMLFRCRQKLKKHLEKEEFSL